MRHVELFGENGRLLEDGDGFEDFRRLGLGLQSQLHDCLKLWLVDHRHAAAEKFIEQHVQNLGLAHCHAFGAAHIAVVYCIGRALELFEHFADVH